MFKSILDDAMHYFRTGNMVVRLILLNIVIFISVNIVQLGLNVSMGGFSTEVDQFSKFIEFFSLSSKPLFLLTHPWGFITHMFIHVSFFHIFWNMILLYWFGRIAGDLLNDKRILPLYVMGGLSGAIVSLLLGWAILGFNGGYGYGASGAVLAVVMAAGMIAPDYRVNMIIFTTRLKYIVAVIIFMNLLGASAFTQSNTGYFAHLGGLLFGGIFVYLLQRGRDLSVPFNNFMDWIQGVFKPKKKVSKRKSKLRAIRGEGNPKSPRKSNMTPSSSSDSDDVQDKVDRILDKIKEKGIESLSQEEKDFLDKIHNKIQ